MVTIKLFTLKNNYREAVSHYPTKENRYGFTEHDMETFKMLKRPRLLSFSSEIQMPYFKLHVVLVLVTLIKYK